MLKFANYAVAVLVLKIMLSCSNYAKNYASTIRQCLVRTFMKIYVFALLTLICTILTQMKNDKFMPVWYSGVKGIGMTIGNPRKLPYKILSHKNWCTLKNTPWSKLNLKNICKPEFIKET